MDIEITMYGNAGIVITDTITTAPGSDPCGVGCYIYTRASVGFFMANRNVIKILN